MTGSICHRCKAELKVKVSISCKNMVDDLKMSKKKICSKNFCFECLKKHFYEYWETRNNKSWKCPCCCGDCHCNSCRKHQEKETQKDKSEDENEKCDKISKNGSGGGLKYFLQIKANSVVRNLVNLKYK